MFGVSGSWTTNPLCQRVTGTSPFAALCTRATNTIRMFLLAQIAAVGSARVFRAQQRHPTLHAAVQNVCS